MSSVGSVARFRRLQVERLESRCLMAVDIAGDQPVSATSVRYHIELTDRLGQPISEVRVGDQFFAKLLVSDLRPEPLGVFAGFTGLGFDREGLQSDSEIVFGDDFIGIQESDAESIGGMASLLVPPRRETSLLATVPLTATTPGTFSLQTLPTLNSITSATLLYGTNEPVPRSAIQFSGASIQVSAGSPTASVVTTSPPNSSAINQPEPINLPPSTLATSTSQVNLIIPISLESKPASSPSNHQSAPEIRSMVRLESQLHRQSVDPLTQSISEIQAHLTLPPRDVTVETNTKDVIPDIPMDGTRQESSSAILQTLRGTWDHGLVELSRSVGDWRSEREVRKKVRDSDRIKHSMLSTDSRSRNELSDSSNPLSDRAKRLRKLRGKSFLAIGRDGSSPLDEHPVASDRMLVDLAESVHESIWSNSDDFASSQLTTYDSEGQSSPSRPSPATDGAHTDSLFAAGVTIESDVQPLSRLELIPHTTTSVDNRDNDANR